MFFLFLKAASRFLPRTLHPKRRAGFTLIELLLVVGIIGALASVVIEAIGPKKMILSAKDASRRQTVNELQNALTQYQIDEGTLPNIAAMIMADDGAKPICKQGVTDTTCVNLDALVPDYIAAVPQDLSEPNALYTGYKVYREPLGGRPQIVSAHLAGRSDGLVGYWPFHEGTGTAAMDQSGNANNGTLNGGTQWVQGRVGTALDFDGTNDYVNIPDSVSLDIAANMSICAWLFPRSTTTSYPLDKHGSSTTSNYRLYFNYPAANQLRYYANRGGIWGTISSTYSSISSGTWMHVCIVYESSRGGQLYINGSANGARAGVGALATNTTPLRLGGITSNFFNGLIDEVRIYNRALSAQEIAALAAGQVN